MLCRQCNTSHDELRRGLCIDCILKIADNLAEITEKKDEIIKKYQEDCARLLEVAERQERSIGKLAAAL